MMPINVSLNVATVDFLRTINNQEVILDTTIKNDMAYLLIYPKEPILVCVIDDIFDNCDYEISGFVNAEIEFNKDNPFKYYLGSYFDDSAPIIMNDDLIFKVINEVMEHKGFLDCGNQSDFILSKSMLFEIRNIGAIITINDNDAVSIDNVDIFDSGNKKDIFIDWINNNYDAIIEKLRSNADTWQGLLDELKQSDKILCPHSAYELAQVKFEYDETKKSLNQYQKEKLLDVPKSELKTLNQLIDGGIVMLNAIIEVDFDNGGNLGVFIESMAKGIPIDFEMVNITENMIDINFKNS